MNCGFFVGIGAPAQYQIPGIPIIKLKIKLDTYLTPAM